MACRGPLEAVVVRPNLPGGGVVSPKGLLWVAWENVTGADGPRGWEPVRGQLLGPDRIIRKCTQTQARRLLKTAAEQAKRIERVS